MAVKRPERSQAVAAPRQADIDRLLTQAMANKVISGASCMLSASLGRVSSAVLHRQSYGYSTFEGGASRALSSNSLFDLGGLTGSLGPAVLCVMWAGQGRMDIRRPVALFLPETAKLPVGSISVAQLLDHTSGLPAAASRLEATVRMGPELPRPRPRAASDMTTPVEKQFRPRADADLPGPLEPAAEARLRQHLLATPLSGVPGAKVEVSELNAIILGWVLEAIGKKPLRTLLFDSIYKRLGLSSGFLLPTNGLSGLHPTRIGSQTFGKTAATLDCSWRRRLMVGETAEKAAWLFGGLLGHSGLFGTIEGVHALLLNLLQAFQGNSQAFHTGTIKRFWTRSQHVAQAWTTLGWQVACRENGMHNSRWTAQSIGQVGSEGCAYFVDPTHNMIGILLTNLTHPSADGKHEAWRELRLRVFDAMASSAEYMARQRGGSAARKL